VVHAAVTGLDRSYLAMAIADTALAAHGGDRASRLRRLTKSALMPLLVAKLSRADAVRPALRTRTRAGLALSWAGDVALLGESDTAFAAGLGCFAGAHGCYGAAFGTARQARPPAAAVPVAAAGVALGGVLARRAGRLGPPVAGYSALITAMAVGALGLDPARVGRPAATRIAAGAGLFVVSDGLIGLRKFGLRATTPRRTRSTIDAAVMATYAAGQWLIADGAARAAAPNGPD
jgi:uncharacterized membrane protein YhhN